MFISQAIETKSGVLPPPFAGGESPSFAMAAPLTQRAYGGSELEPPCRPTESIEASNSSLTTQPMVRWTTESHARAPGRFPVSEWAVLDSNQ